MGCVPVAEGEVSTSLKSKMRPEDETLWQQVLKYNFDTQKFKYILELQDLFLTRYGQFLSPSHAASLILEFKKFLFLVAQDYQNLTKNAEGKTSSRSSMSRQIQIRPSPMVDRLWKLLISCHASYQKFCTDVIGAFHYRETRRLAHISYYHRTIKRLEVFFGEEEFNETLWPLYQYEEDLVAAHQGFVRISVRNIFYFCKIVEQMKREKRTDAIGEVCAIQLRKWRHQLEKEQGARNPVLFGYLQSEEIEHSQDEKEQPPFFKRDGQIDSEEMQESLVNRNMTQSLVRPEKRKIESVLQPQEVDSETDEEFTDVNVNEEASKYKRHDRKSSFSKQADSGNETVKRTLGVHWKVRKDKFQKEVDEQVISDLATKNFKQETCLPDDQVSLIFSEYTRFLILRALSKDSQMLVCPHILRLAWHHHYFEIRSYSQYCKKAFGKVLHPDTPPREITKRQKEAHLLTLSLYTHVFGTPPSTRIWAKTELHYDYDKVFNVKLFNAFDYIWEKLSEGKSNKRDVASSLKLKQILSRQQLLIAAIEGMERSEKQERGTDCLVLNAAD